jgi:hypothetical protein
MKLITGFILFPIFASSFAQITLPITSDDSSPLDTVLGLLDLNGLTGNGKPPLATSIHSPECVNLNGGTYVCCESTFNGGLPLVEALSEATDYPITPDTINGFVCKFL